MRALYALPLLLLAFADCCSAAETPGEEQQICLSRDARCGQVLTRCQINGKPMTLLVDTGATHTVLHTSVAAEKLPDAEKMDTSRVQFNSSSSRQRPDILLVSLTLDKRVFRNQPVLVLPLDGVRAAMETPIDGILGMDVLKEMSFTLDFRKKGESKWKEVKDSSAKAVALKGHPDAGFCPMLTVKAGDKEISEVLLDSGSSVTVLAEADWSAGVEGTVEANLADVNGGRKEGVRVGCAADLELAPGVKQKVRPQLGAGNRQGINGLVGVDALAGLRLVYTPEKGFYLLVKDSKKKK